MSYSSHRSDCAAITLALLLTAGAAFAAQPNPPKPLPEGTILENIDGRLMHADANDTWLFELIADANTIAGSVHTGTQFQVLPSAILGQLVADVNDRYAPLYRLSARATLYHGKNFLFPSYYLPLSKFKDDTPSATLEERVPTGDQVTDANQSDPELAIPPEVLEKLRERRPPRGPQRSGQVPADARKKSTQMLVDAVGMISASAEGAVFTSNAFGWNIGQTQYRLPPCSVLEQALRTQAALPEPVRFSVAGSVTEFKGTKYLLLERATRAYGYGNFGR